MKGLVEPCVSSVRVVQVGYGDTVVDEDRRRACVDFAVHVNSVRVNDDDRVEVVRYARLEVTFDGRVPRRDAVSLERELRDDAVRRGRRRRRLRECKRRESDAYESRQLYKKRGRSTRRISTEGDHLTVLCFYIIIG